jgi:hypothetical protein
VIARSRADLGQCAIGETLVYSNNLLSYTEGR